MRPGPRRPAAGGRPGSRPGPGIVRPARSANVHAVRNTRSCPRADSRPRSSAPTSGATVPGASRKRRRSTGPGTSALRRSPSSASRAAAAARATPTRSRTTAVDSGAAADSSNATRRTGRTTTRRSTRSSSAPDSRPRYRRRASDGQVHVRSSTHACGQGFAASTSWKRAGNRAVPLARAMSTQPLSSGCRSASITPARNSGASSRNSTPRCARLAAPGRRIRPPPPTIAGNVALWCGLRSGGRRSSGAPGASRPATECTALTSRASSSSSAGQQPGQPRREHRLAGTGRAVQEDVMSAGCRDLQRQAPEILADDIGQIRLRRRLDVRCRGPTTQSASPSLSPRSTATRSTSRATPLTRTPATSAASAAFAAGTITRSHPARDAASTAGRTPRVARTRPSNPNSPSRTQDATASAGTTPCAARTAARDGQVERAAALRQRGG